MFGKKLFELRKEKGMTQEQLAEKINVSRQTISKWEAGQAVPDLINAVKISELFGITVDFLLKDEKPDIQNKKNDENKKLVGTICLIIGLAGIILVLVFVPFYQLIQFESFGQAYTNAIYYLGEPPLFTAIIFCIIFALIGGILLKNKTNIIK